ncbi:hypothetical protein Avbf_15840, partial [Armadillidium vulgare]
MAKWIPRFIDYVCLIFLAYLTMSLRLLKLYAQGFIELNENSCAFTTILGMRSPCFALCAHFQRSMITLALLLPYLVYAFLRLLSCVHFQRLMITPAPFTTSFERCCFWLLPCIFSDPGDFLAGLRHCCGPRSFTLRHVSWGLVSSDFSGFLSSEYCFLTDFGCALPLTRLMLSGTWLTRLRLRPGALRCLHSSSVVPSSSGNWTIVTPFVRVFSPSIAPVLTRLGYPNLSGIRMCQHTQNTCYSLLLGVLHVQSLAVFYI